MLKNIAGEFIFYLYMGRPYDGNKFFVIILKVILKAGLIFHMEAIFSNIV